MLLDDRNEGLSYQPPLRMAELEGGLSAPDPGPYARRPPDRQSESTQRRSAILTEQPPQHVKTKGADRPLRRSATLPSKRRHLESVLRQR